MSTDADKVRVILLLAYVDMLHRDGLLKPDDPTCKLFACVEDDRMRFAALRYEARAASPEPGETPPEGRQGPL